MPRLSEPAEGYAPLLSFGPGGDNIDTEKSLTPHQKPARKYSSTVIYTAVACLAFGFALGLLIRQTSRTSASPRPSCENPAIRHEWRSLSKREKGAYLQAVQCLRTTPSRLGLNQTLYDDFPYLHTRTGEDGMSSFRRSQDSKHDLSQSTAHYTAAFLSWHRWFLHIYESALRQQCGYTGHLTYTPTGANYISSSMSNNPNLVTGTGPSTGKTSPWPLSGTTSSDSVVTVIQATSLDSAASASPTALLQDSRFLSSDLWKCLTAYHAASYTVRT